MNSSISPVSDIVAEFKAGRMVVLVDDEDRENEGDLVLAADFVTPEAINFMARNARGLICLTLTEDRCRQLALPLMTSNNQARTGTNFTMSIEAAEGVTTGISAADRARTVQVAVAPRAKPEDIVQPGHIFPIMAREGGVLIRAGHTEAGCDLGKLTGLTPAAVICEIMNEDGTMARMPDLVVFAREHGLKLGTIADLIEYRNAHESLVECLKQTRIHTSAGPFELRVYRDTPTGQPHLALHCGDVARQDPVLVRVHEPFSPLDVLNLEPRRHSWSVHAALEYIRDAGCGVVVLLNCAQEAASVFTLFERELAEQSASTPPPSGAAHGFKPDLRTYGIGAQILRDLGVRRMKVLAQPRRMPSMTGYGLDVVGFVDSSGVEHGMPTPDSSAHSTAHSAAHTAANISANPTANTTASTTANTTPTTRTP